MTYLFRLPDGTVITPARKARLEKRYARWQDEDPEIWRRLSEPLLKARIVPTTELIGDRRHSMQCRRPTDHVCHCWCKGEYHGVRST